MKRILFHFAHPAQFHMFKPTVLKLKSLGIHVDITINSKDILENLLIESGLDFDNILRNRRKKNTRLASFLTLLKKDFALFKFTKNRNYALLIGTESALAHVGWLKNIPVITFNEDDIGVIKDAARIAFPFTSKIVSPNVCDLGKYEYKKVGYEGYQKLAYLHPKRFKPDRDKVEDLFGPKGKYFLIRVSELSAYHDNKESGLSIKLLNCIIDLLSPYGKIYISSERELPDKYDPYILNKPLSFIHDIMSFSEGLITDSQSMAVEAAMLGTPSIRFNSFVGKISILEELEHKYGLTIGVHPDNSQKLIQSVEELVGNLKSKSYWLKKRDRMLSDKIDVSAFWINYILSY